MKEIVLAGGCFWGVEAYINTLAGIIETKVGYANGKTQNPTYKEVCSNNTGFAEACYIKYDEGKIDLSALLKAYWMIIDPTSLNRQGNDMGSQYRTGIYYIDENDLNTIIESKNKESEKHSRKVVTEITKLINFYDAKEYHQKYLEKNPNGYCHIPKDLLKK